MSNYPATVKLPFEGEIAIGDNRPPTYPRARKKEPIKTHRLPSKTLTVDEVRKDFSDIINEVSYCGVHTAITRRGIDLAVIVPAASVPSSIITEAISSKNARDNISDILNRIRYRDDVLSINRRSKVLAVIMSVQRFIAPSVGQPEQGEGPINWNTLKGQMSGQGGDHPAEPEPPRPTSKRKARDPRP